MTKNPRHILIICTSLIFFFGIILAYNFVKWPHNKITFQQINSFHEATPQIMPCNNSLILFDIDDTLISTVDTMGHTSPPLLFKLRALIKHPQLLFRKNWEYYYSIMWQQTEWFIIEPDTVSIIADLKKQDCIVLGLTSMETGTFGTMENFPEWRSQILTQLGIEFSHKFPNAIFNKLPRHRNNYPELYNGLLCCNQQSKGLVVSAFLDQFQLQPNMIIFFDDSANNLASVEDACKQRNIPFKGFQYRGAEKLSQKWDMQKALLQLDYLIQNKKWLSDNNITLVH